MEKTISKFLRSIHVQVSTRYVEKLILSHADYPSLLSISDAFERLGISYSVFRTKREELINIDLPFMLPLDSGGGDVVMVETHRQLENTSQLDGWSGVVICADNSRPVTDKKALEARTVERVTTTLGTILLVSFASALILPFIISFNWLYVLMLALSGGGAIVGYILVAKDIGIRYKSVESFCNTSKEVSCDKVLGSDGATIFGILKFSDIVMIYFSFQALALWCGLIFPEASTSILFTMAVLSLAGLPVVGYSIYYQWSVVGAWCRLCLLVDAVMVSQSLVFTILLFGNALRGLDLLTVALTLAALVFDGIAFVWLRIFVARLNRSEQNETLASRIRNNTSVFMGLLKQQDMVDTMPFEKELVAGDRNAPVKIVMGTNLFCNPCKEKHSAVADLLANYPGKISISFRFVRAGRVPESVSYILRYWLKNIDGRENESAACEQLLHDWFHYMDFEKFKTRYPIDDDEYNVIASTIENQHYEWVNKGYFQRTPAFFVNGYRLPPSYDMEHLAGLIPSLTYEIEKLRKLRKTLQEH